jgi:hypothetical protein
VTTRKGVRLLALPIVVAIVAAGCGSSGGSGDDSASDTAPDAAPVEKPLDIVKQSIETTRDSGTARVAHALISDITAFSANEASVGVANLKTGDGEWTHDMSDTPNGLVPPGTPPDEIVQNVREVGQDLFVSLPPAFKAAGIDDKWIRVPDEPPAGTSGFVGLEGMSPRIALSARFERPDLAFSILDTVTAAREVGTATVRGKETTRYSIDVKLRQMLTDVGLMFYFGNPSTPAELKAIDDVCAQAAHVDVFVDQLGRIRELLVDADLTVVAPHFDPPQDPKFWRELRVEWDFYDYGVDVSVQAPTTSVHVGA